MKKFLAILMCAFLLLTFTVTTFAEEIVIEEVVTEEAATEEVVTEGIVTEEVTPDESPDPFNFTVDDVLNWIKENYDKISVVVTLFFYVLFSIRKARTLNNSITTVNNNAVNIASDSKTSLANSEKVVKEYQSKMESMFSENSKYLKATRLANLELANEVAELLVLANIPNSKKDELYARHLAAVNAIAEAESAVETEEVKENEEIHEE
jgi:hypothetical protein